MDETDIVLLFMTYTQNKREPDICIIILIPVSCYLTLKKMNVVFLIDENVHYQYRLKVALCQLFHFLHYIFMHCIKIFQCFISFDVVEYSRKLNGHS